MVQRAARPVWVLRPRRDSAWGRLRAAGGAPSPCRERAACGLLPLKPPYHTHAELGRRVRRGQAGGVPDWACAGDGRLVSFGPRARRRWLTCAMPLSCRQSLAAARCRLPPLSPSRPSTPLPVSRFLLPLPSSPSFPFAFRSRPTLPFASSFRRSRPSLRSSFVFVFRCCRRLVRLSVRLRFLPNWRSWQNRDVAARERGSRCQICRNGTTKPLRERA